MADDHNKRQAPPKHIIDYIAIIFSAIALCVTILSAINSYHQVLDSNSQATLAKTQLALVQHQLGAITSDAQREAEQLAALKDQATAQQRQVESLNRLVQALNDANAQMADTTKEERIYQDANIILRLPQLNFVGGGLLINLVFSNDGHSTAEDVILLSETVLVNLSASGQPYLESNSAWTCPDGVDYDEENPIQAGSTYEKDISADIPARDATAMGSGKEAILFDGCLQYTTQGQTQTVPYCFFVTGDPISHQAMSVNDCLNSPS